jgi:hypothetical protein
MNYNCVKPFGEQTPAEAASCTAESVGNYVSDIFYRIGDSIGHIVQSPQTASINDWVISIIAVGFVIYPFVLLLRVHYTNI